MNVLIANAADIVIDVILQYLNILIYKYRNKDKGIAAIKNFSFASQTVTIVRKYGLLIICAYLSIWMIVFLHMLNVWYILRCFGIKLIYVNSSIFILLYTFNLFKFSFLIYKFTTFRQLAPCRRITPIKYNYLMLYI